LKSALSKDAKLTHFRSLSLESGNAGFCMILGAAQKIHIQKQFFHKL
jgi:hypothetical protein